MKKVLLMLLVLLITSVGVVLAHFTKKESEVEIIDDLKNIDDNTIKTDVASWD